MAIPASYIVKVSSRVISGGSADLETNGLLLTTDTGNKFTSGLVAKTFVSADEVGKFFGDGSEEFSFATQYFKGVENQQKIPTALVVGKFSNTATAFDAEIRAITQVTQNWVGFTHLQPVAEDVARKMGAFADREEDFVAVVWTSDEATTTSKNTSTLAFKLKDSFHCLAVVFGGFLDAAFVLANGASIAWTRRQGVKTWFAKSASGLTPRVNDEGAANALDQIRCNYYGQFATRNAQFKFFNPGVMSTTRYGYLDVIYNSIWLRNAIQRACMDGFKSVNRTPYNDEGKTLITAWCGDVIDAAKLNGIIDTGVALSQAQRAQILQETGDEDVANALFTKGYWMGITLPPANGRSNRQPPVVSLYWAYAGSVQKLNVEATVIL